MLLEMYSTKASQLIAAFLSSALNFLSGVTVPGTNISFFRLFGTILLATVFITLFRRFLGMEFDINVQRPLKDGMKDRRSVRRAKSYQRRVQRSNKFSKNSN